MENIFSLEKQSEQYALGKQYFLDGNYKEAQSILYLVLQSTLQHNDYDTYVDVQVLMNRLYINTSQFDKLQYSLMHLHSYIPQYGCEESHYFYRLQQIIFNRFYSIGNPIEDYKVLYTDLKETSHIALLFITGSNLMLEYVENSQSDLAIELYDELIPFIEKYKFENKMMLYIQNIYLFLAYFCKGDYDKCETVLQIIANDSRYAVVDSFAYMYDICKALLLGVRYQLDEAKTLMDIGISKVDNFEHIRFELKLWINILKEANKDDQVIYYQDLLIETLEKLYTSEVSEIRRRSIEEKSKQYYETQMYIDQLTGVRNRNFYENLLAKQQKVKNYCVAVLDIDRFKLINDTYGHTVGDEAIKFLAKGLMDGVVKHDIEIIRFGGDEFILLIPYPFEKVEAKIYELHKNILTTPFISSKDALTIPISISIGVSYTEYEYVTIHELFEVADRAIYEAKKTRATVVVKPLS